MIVNEVFTSIQGEGDYIGYPVLFIRMSGCNLKCEWCDSKYTKDGKVTDVEELVKTIDSFKEEIVVWTGGEPTIQLDQILNVMKNLKTKKKHHLETNGTILKEELTNFDYISFSPKTLSTLTKVNEFNDEHKIPHCTKIVTDTWLVGDSMLALCHHDSFRPDVILMPLTVANDVVKTIEIKQKVWKYCVQHNVRFAPRIHIDTWGIQKRGV